MRTWGRVNNTGEWIKIDTTDGDDETHIWITTLAQCLLLNLGESPFFANYGIPQVQTILQQIYPDFYVATTQRQFSQYFASLIISRRPTGFGGNPIYDVRIVTKQGVHLNAAIPIPT